jgi:hypothetical protein
VYRGTDEWCNPSVGVSVPFVADVDIFYGREKPDRSGWWLSHTSERPEGGPIHATYVSPDYALTAVVVTDHNPFDDDCPHAKSAEWVAAHASRILSLEDEE